ncbi:uncharacterized protein UV8b_00974 [Ustilaginoidea virens]|uniref:Sialidase domain-containing protein n=1 Tax=Ustilaginoidea virens TaxID=1159556 RepID=A0A063BRU2_USTVR|nr:uncharacterized protein UV8b_00974 [Ustilaginoidea virens]QUC16733.1 hypothetical protein UV8b_00974 [Ustilaginoidea virens]GAO17982.1 hypothetical protein UVI_02056090 [Ustilaginoidea virens]
MGGGSAGSSSGSGSGSGPGSGPPLRWARLLVALVALLVPASRAEIGDGIWRWDRNVSNWYSYGWYDALGRHDPAHHRYNLFFPANSRRADLGAAGQKFHSFRNPSVVNCDSGRLVAFAEGRRYDNRDFGHISIVVKRQKDKDQGKARWMAHMLKFWMPLSELTPGAAGSWTNPTAVPDGDTLYLFMNWNRHDRSRRGNETLATGEVTRKVDATPEGRRRLFLTQSPDDGLTWTTPVDVTDQLTPPGWGWDVVGPGRGIVLRSGEVVVPAMGRNIVGRGPPGKRTWSYVLLDGSGEEGTIVQTPDDGLLRNDKGLPGDNFRRVARGNLTHFEPFRLDTALPDHIDGGGAMVQWSWRNMSVKYPDDNRIVFVNPYSSTNTDRLRCQLTYYHDGSRYTIWRDLQDKKAVGRHFGIESRRASISFRLFTTEHHLVFLSEMDFRQTGGSKDDHVGLLFRHTSISWLLHGNQQGLMGKPKEEKDPYLRLVKFDPERKLPMWEKQGRTVEEIKCLVDNGQCRGVMRQGTGD